MITFIASRGLRAKLCTGQAARLVRHFSQIIQFCTPQARRPW